ncbi:MAG TPA: tetratricopeptide repeat protein [Urbifossiella sp.]|nr:tetratricopeptide repeat protein [Urbifossiella sp.]
MNSPRLALVGLLILALAVAGFFAARWAWFRGEPPAIPHPQLEGVHPFVVEAVNKALGEVRADPRSGPAWGNLGIVLMMNGLRRDAIYALQQAAQLDSDEPRWHYFLATQLEYETPEQAVAPFRRAVELVDANDPANVAPRLRLAQLLLQLEQLKEAEVNYAEVRRLEPDNSQALYGSGLVAMAQGDFEQAEAYLRQAVKSPSCRRKASSRLAYLVQRRGGDASEFARQATLPPKDLAWKDPYMDRVRGQDQARESLFQAAHQREAREGPAPFQELVQLFPSGRSYLALASALMRSGDRIGAEEAFRKAVEEPDLRVPAEFTFGAFLYQDAEKLSHKPADRDEMLKRAREAADHVREALKIKSDHAFSHLKLGEIQLLLGERADAIRSFRAGLECRPELSEGHLLLGQALARDGQKELARKELEEAVRLASGPEEKPARQALEQFNKLP